MGMLEEVTSGDHVLVVWSDLGSDPQTLQDSVNIMKVGFIDSPCQQGQIFGVSKRVIDFSWVESPKGVAGPFL